MADIHSKVPTEDYRSNFDRIFGKGPVQTESGAVVDVTEFTAVESNKAEPSLTIGAFGEDTVQFSSGGSIVLEISNGSFLVRGKPVAQDADEAETVYAEFKKWIGVNTGGERA